MLKRFLVYFSSSIVLILIAVMAFWLSLSEERILSWSQHQLDGIAPRQMQTIVQGMRTRIWGLEVEQVELVNTARRESLLKISQIRIPFDVISILFKQELSFSYELYGGSGTGAVSLLSDHQITLNAGSLELNWIPVVRRSQLLKSNPILNVSGVYTPLKNSGDLRFDVRNVKLSGDKNNTTLTVDLPDTNLKSVSGSVTLNKNRLDLVVDTSGDITASLSGKLIGNWNKVQRSRVDLRLKADMKNSYQERLGLLNNILNSYRTKNGSISVRLTGNLMLPKIQKI